MSAKEPPIERVNLDIYTTPGFVHTRTFTKQQLLAFQQNMDQVWDICRESVPMLDVMAHMATDDPILMEGFKSYAFTSEDALNRFKQNRKGFTYRYTTMCISTACLMTSTQVAFDLLQYDPHGVLLGIQAPLKDILVCEKQPIHPDIQLGALSNITYRSAINLYPTKPHKGMVDFLSIFNMDDERLKKVLTVVINKIGSRTVVFDS